jgi:hypothetical protein
VIDVSVAVLACCSCCKERLLTAEADLNKLHDEGAPAHQIEHAEEVVAARQVQEFYPGAMHYGCFEARLGAERWYDLALLNLATRLFSEATVSTHGLLSALDKMCGER